MAKKIYIDPGHGGTDSGAVGVNNLLEKDINLQVAKKVRDLLVKQGMQVKMSRETDKALSLEYRTNDANSWNANCFVSIHCNAYNGSAKGIETYGYSTNTTDLANNIHPQVINTKAYTLNRGVKTANFYVLRNSKMRACLIELGFIDNLDDAKILLQKQDDLALGITKGIFQYMGIEYKPESDDQKPPIIDENTFYRVVCGSFNNRVYAEEKIEELKSLGINDVFIDIYHKE